MKHAPPEMLEEFRKKAKDLDLLPETKFVDDVGQPVYSAQQIAEKLGVPLEQVERDIQQLFGAQLVTGQVHQIQ